MASTLASVRKALTFLTVLGAAGLASAINVNGTVALPYGTYQGSLNDTYSLWKYHNIRYADPPTGDLRFKNPVAPTTVETTIQDGSYGQTCYQLEQGPLSTATNQGEDCLFLDVIVPADIPEGTTLPVLFYVFGGGYHSGYKEIYEGSGLVIAGNNSFIFVIPNYRLGAFGWLGQYGDTAPGLQDQRLAMEWVQSYIHLFGGDPDRVTAAGHSAGGGSMLAHLISNGGEGTVPFQKAVTMSPAIPPLAAARVAERNNEMIEFFGYGSYTEEEILALPASAINDMSGHIGASGWGPIIDGNYTREGPGPAFAAGRFHSGMPVITGQLKDEAHNYMPTDSPYIIDGDSDIRDMSYDTKDLMIEFFSDQGYNLSTDVIDQAWELYPLINETDLYYTIFGKYDRVLTEILFTCNTYYVSEAYDIVYGWYFDIYPAYHAQENPYLFVGGTGTGATSSYVINSTVSLYMQTYLSNFIVSDINADSPSITPEWDMYSIAQENIELGSTGVGMIANPSNNDRCAFWQQNTT